MLRKHFQNVGAEIEKAIIAGLFLLGEQCVNHARQHADFMDQTGNLRNSIGYVVLKDGREIGANFTRTAKPTASNSTGKDGLKVGADFARSLIAQYGSGYALIVVAGMEYAAAVEAKGKNVLTSAEQFAETRLPIIKRQIEAA